MEQSPLAPIVCTKCNFPVSRSILAISEHVICLNCQSVMDVYIFPAFFKPAEIGTDAELLTAESEASCFYHPDKRAFIICSQCGRFLCSLCDLEIKEKHICPGCLDKDKAKNKTQDLETRRTNYDQLALMLALLPLFIFYLTVLTAPIAIYISVRYWNFPLGITRRSKFRFIAAIFFASLEIVGWIAGIYYLFFHLF
jgi:hypothetical protein